MTLSIEALLQYLLHCKLTSMDSPTQMGTANISRMRRIIGFLLSNKAKTFLPYLFFATLLLSPISRMAMTFLFPLSWQISGYYLDGLFYGILLLLGGLWVGSTFLLFIRHHWLHGVGRLLALTVLLFLGYILFVLSAIILPSNISGWPIDSISSPNRKKHYILSLNPCPVDVMYRIFSTNGTRLNPIWEMEIDGIILNYSKDGSLTSDRHLLLSQDENVLVIRCDGHLTDAFLLDTHQHLTKFVSTPEGTRDAQLQYRTMRIQNILDAHAMPPQRSMQMTDSEVKATLHAWCSRMESHLAKTPLLHDYAIACTIQGIESDTHGCLNVIFTIEGKKEGICNDYTSYMSLIRDGKHFLVFRQNSSMNDDEKEFTKQVRSVLIQYADSGMYLNQP